MERIAQIIQATFHSVVGPRSINVGCVGIVCPANSYKTLRSIWLHFPPKFFKKKKSKNSHPPLTQNKRIENQIIPLSLVFVRTLEENTEPCHASFIETHLLWVRGPFSTESFSGWHTFCPKKLYYKNIYIWIQHQKVGSWSQTPPPPPAQKI